MAAHLVLAKFNGLTNSYMTPEQRAAVVPFSEEYNSRVWGSKIQVMGWSFYAMILWLVKFSVAIFYSRLTYVHTARLGTGVILNRNQDWAAASAHASPYRLCSFGRDLSGCGPVHCLGLPAHT